MRTTTPDIKCRNCANLQTYKDPEGLLIRCGLGHYDHGTTPVLYSVLALKSGNVGIWKAMEKCGTDYRVAEAERRFLYDT